MFRGYEMGQFVWLLLRLVRGVEVSSIVVEGRRRDEGISRWEGIGEVMLAGVCQFRIVWRILIASIRGFQYLVKHKIWGEPTSRLSNPEGRGGPSDLNENPLSKSPALRPFLAAEAARSAALRGGSSTICSIILPIIADCDSGSYLFW